MNSLLDRFAAGPELVRQSVTGLTHEQVRARPIAGKWSTLEVVSHLADFEIVGADRLAAVIAEQDPVLPGRCEQKFAARLAYEQRDLDEQLRLIAACRSHTIRILRSLNSADWQRQGIHSEAGPLTLEQLLERIVRHVEHHVRFINDKREALGR